MKSEPATEDELCYSCYGLLCDQSVGKKMEKVYRRDALTWRERYKQREEMLKEQSTEEMNRRINVKSYMELFPMGTNYFYFYFLFLFKCSKNVAVVAV